MITVTLLDKFEVVEPPEARDALHPTPREQLHVRFHDGRLELVPVRGIQSPRGLLKVMYPDIDRDEDRP